MTEETKAPTDLEKAKESLELSTKAGQDLDAQIEELRNARRDIARQIEAATLDIQRLSPPNPIPPTAIGK